MNFIFTHLVTATIFLPLAGMLFVLAVPSRWRTSIRAAALIVSLLPLITAIQMFARVKGTGEFELIDTLPWIPSLGISYHVGVDGASMLLILLTAILVPVSIVASWREIDKGIKGFHALILLAEAGLIGTFAALDVFLFYIFWELVLIPMYFIIGVWGSGDRIKAAMKFVIFTMAGSVLMLVAIIFAATKAGSFDLLAWYAFRFGTNEQMWLFAAFALAFAIKVPIIGVHTWLPDAHTEAPTAGSVLLAGVLLKMGAYGFFRFAMPLFPAAVAEFTPAFLMLAVAGIIAGALLAMVQPDLKRLVAYSSVSHMGFVMLGLFALDPQAVAGAILQMINHGITTGALFLMVGMIYARRHTRMIADYGGTARSLPAFAMLFIFMCLSSMGLPGLNNFAGEFLVLLGSFQTRTPYAAAAITGVILVAVYLLWMVGRVFFGRLKHDEERQMRDLTAREYAILIPLCAMIIMIGVWPQSILTKVWRPAEAFIKLSKRIEMIIPLSNEARSTNPATQSSAGKHEARPQGNTEDSPNGN